MYEWRSGRRCVIRTRENDQIFQMIFFSKYKSGFFSNEILSRSEEITERICFLSKCKLLSFSGEQDHIIFSIKTGPKIEISTLINSIRGKISYFLSREFPKELKPKMWRSSLWARSYLLISDSLGAEEKEKLMRDFILDQRKEATTQSLATIRANINPDIKVKIPPLTGELAYKEKTVQLMQWKIRKAKKDNIGKPRSNAIIRDVVTTIFNRLSDQI